MKSKACVIVLAGCLVQGLAAKILPETMMVSQHDFYPSANEQDRGYFGRYTDQPLRIDPSLPNDNPCRARQSQAEFDRTWEMARSYGLDGMGCFLDGGSGSVGNFGAVTNGAPKTGFLLPIYRLWLHPEQDDACTALLVNSPAVNRYRGKVVAIAYWTQKYFTPEALAKELKGLRERHGDKFWFIADVNAAGRFSQTFQKNGAFSAVERETLKKEFRAYLDVADGIYFGETHMLSKVELDERVFDDACYRAIVRLMREVLDEPPYKGVKFLGLSAMNGHENAYTRGYNVGHDGTRSLRHSLSVAVEAQPDVINLPEWDEYNENTCFAPTLYGGLSVKRIVRFFAAKLGKVPLAPLPGDDTTVPNLIVSYRKCLTSGEHFFVEVTNVPDGSSSNEVQVAVRLFNERGEAIAAGAAQRLCGDTLEDVRFEFAAAELAKKARAVSVVVAWRTKDGRRGTVREGLHPVDLASANAWNHKCVKQALRDLAPMTKTEVSFADGRLTASLAAQEPFRYVFVENNCGIRYVAGDPASPSGAYREDENYAVFAVTAAALARMSAPFTLTVDGATKVSWYAVGYAVLDERELCLSGTSQFAPVFYVRIPKADLASARLKIAFPPHLAGEVAFATAYEKGAWALGGGDNQLQVTVARFQGASAYPDVMNQKTATFSVPLAKDRDDDFYTVQAVTMSGKTWRSRPFVTSAAKKPVLDYDFAPGAGDVLLPRSGERRFFGMLGGAAPAATLFNRGAECGNPMEEFRSAYAKGDTRPTRVQETDGTWSLAFDGQNDTVMLPVDTIPSTEPYRLSFKVRPETTPEKEMILGARAYGSGPMWLSRENGVLRVVCLVSGPHIADYNTGLQLPAGAWSTVVIENRGTEMRVTVNGRTVTRPGRYLPGLYTTAGNLGGIPDAGLFTGRLNSLKIETL